MEYILLVTVNVCIDDELDGDIEQQTQAYGTFHSVEQATEFAKTRDFIGQEDYVCHEVVPLNKVTY